MENKVIPNPILPVAGVHRNITADGGAGPPSGGHNDDRISNPAIVPARVLSDHSTLPNATFNVCTAREGVRLMELAHCAEEWRAEILGIQDHRRMHTDDQIVYRRVVRLLLPRLYQLQWRLPQCLPHRTWATRSKHHLLEENRKALDLLRLMYGHVETAGLHPGEEEVEELHHERWTMLHIQFCGLRPTCGLHRGASDSQGPQTKPQDPVWLESPFVAILLFKPGTQRRLESISSRWIKVRSQAANTRVLLLRTKRQPNCVCLCWRKSELPCNPNTQRW